MNNIYYRNIKCLQLFIASNIAEISFFLKKFINYIIIKFYLNKTALNKGTITFYILTYMYHEYIHVYMRLNMQIAVIKIFYLSQK